MFADKRKALVEAISRSQAIIEFTPDGTILDANENFLKTVGYRLDEIRGKHHSLFVRPQDRESAEYRSFWATLARGEVMSGEFRRMGKEGRDIWLQASYSPILGRAGRVVRVVKVAADVSEAKRRAIETDGEIAAIRRSQAVISFAMDGTILDANDNFLKALGYRLDEIVGRNHSLFVSESYARSPDYRRFWDDLRAGQFQSNEFQRFGKGGKEVWIQATYNPILDEDGKPVKVVKFATDRTEQVSLRKHREAVQRQIDVDLDAVAAAIA